MTQPVKSQFIPFNSELYSRMRMAQEAPTGPDTKLYGQASALRAKEFDTAQEDVNYARTLLSKHTPYDNEDKIILDKYKQDIDSQLMDISETGNLRGKASQLSALRQRIVEDTGSGILGDISKNYQVGMETSEKARNEYSKGNISYSAMMHQIENAKSGEVVGKSTTISDVDKLLKEQKTVYDDISDKDAREMFTNIANTELAKEREYNQKYMSESEYNQWESGISSMIEQNIYDKKKGQNIYDKKKGSSAKYGKSSFTNSYMVNSNKAIVNKDGSKPATDFLPNKLAYDFLVGVDNIIKTTGKVTGNPNNAAVFDAAFNKYALSKQFSEYLSSMDKDIIMKNHPELINRIMKMDGVENEEQAYEKLMDISSKNQIQMSTTYTLKDKDFSQNIVAQAALTNDGETTITSNGETYDISEDKFSNFLSNYSKIDLYNGNIHVNTGNKTIPISANNLGNHGVSLSTASSFSHEYADWKSDKNVGFFMGNSEPMELELDGSNINDEKNQNKLITVLANSKMDRSGNVSGFIIIPSEKGASKKVVKVGLVDDNGTFKVGIEKDTKGNPKYYGIGEINDYYLNELNSLSF